MKSIKQQYIDLKEGKMSQQNFMRNLRMTMPQYVTNVTSYGDAVKILKNKGILTESFIKQLEKGLEVEKEHGKNDVETAQIALDHLKEDPKYYSKLDKAGLEEDMDATASAAEKLAKQMGDYDSAVVALQDEMGLSNSEASRIAASIYPEGEVEDMIKKYEEEESGKYTTGGEQFSIKENKSKWEKANGKAMYAQFKEIDNLNGQEVLIGIDYEMQENEELSKVDAAKIVIKNLKKNPIYYTAMLMAGGKEMTEIPTIGKLKPGSDKMRELKGEDSLIDKDNRMKLVKDVEKVKASSNKATKETNKPEKGISLMSLVAKASRGVDKMSATGEKMKVVKEGMEDERDFGPEETEPSSMFQRFASQKRGEEAAAAQASEIHNGLKRGDKVKINSEAARELRINPEEVFTISSFKTFRPGTLLQSIDVVLKNSAGKEVGSVNVEHVYEAGSETPQTTDVPSTIFSRNAGISQKLKSLTKDDLMEMIRKELEEALGAYNSGDNVTDVAGHQLDENK